MQCSLDYHFIRAPVQGSFTRAKPIVLKIGPRKRPVVLPPKSISHAPITKRRSIIASNVRDTFPEHPNRAPFAICNYFFPAL